MTRRGDITGRCRIQIVQVYGARFLAASSVALTRVGGELQMYTVASYLTYVAAAVVISAFLFAAWLIFMLLDMGIRSLTLATRQAARHARRFIADRPLLPALHRTIHLLTARPRLHSLQHAVQLVVDRSVLRSLLHRGATEQTH